MGRWRVPPSWQKFLNDRLSNFLPLHLSNLDFESEKHQNCWFRGAIIFVMGVRMVRNLCLSDFGLIRKKKVFYHTKVVRHLPSPLWVDFHLSKSKKSPFVVFDSVNVAFSEVFFVLVGDPPVNKHCCQQQINQNRPIWWAHPKICNIWPPKLSNPKSILLPSRKLRETLHVSVISRIKIFQTNQKNWKEISWGTFVKKIFEGRGPPMSPIPT